MKNAKVNEYSCAATRNVWNVANNRVSCKTIPRQFLGNFSSFFVRSAASLKHSETLPARSRDVRLRLPSALRWSSNAPGNLPGSFWGSFWGHFWDPPMLPVSFWGHFGVSHMRYTFKLTETDKKEERKGIERAETQTESQLQWNKQRERERERERERNQ